MQIIIAVIGLTAMALLAYYFWILMKGDGWGKNIPLPHPDAL